MPHGLARFLAPLVLAPLVLTGCGDSGSARSSSVAEHTERENRVAGDRSATAQDVIEAGGPVRVAVSQHRTLVAWRAQFEDDEGPQQAAWRLYDEDGRRIADGKLGLVVEAGAIPTLTSLPDGFLVENYTGHVLRHIDLDGMITDVASAHATRATAAGDVLQESLVGAAPTIYRPRTRTAYRLPRLPFENPQGVVLDGAGTVWVLVDWSSTRAHLASSPGGTGPWLRTNVPLRRPGGTPSGLTVAAGQVLLATQHGTGESPRIDGVWKHSVSVEPGAPWVRVPTTGVTFRSTLGPGVAAFGDGRLVLTGDSGEVWVQSGGGTFGRLSLPSSLENGLLEVVGSKLFLSFARDHELHVSEDSGRSWRVVPR